jgi:hypothetical protein
MKKKERLYVCMEVVKENDCDDGTITIKFRPKENAKPGEWFYLHPSRIVKNLRYGEIKKGGLFLPRHGGSFVRAYNFLGISDELRLIADLYITKPEPEQSKVEKLVRSKAPKCWDEKTIKAVTEIVEEIKGE